MTDHWQESPLDQFHGSLLRPTLVSIIATYSSRDARLSPECYRCRSCCICLEHLLRRERNHVTIERVCFKPRLLIPRTLRLGSITLYAAQKWSRLIPRCRR